MKKFLSNFTGKHYLIGIGVLLLVAGGIYLLYDTSERNRIKDLIAQIDKKITAFMSSRSSSDTELNKLYFQREALRQQLSKLI